MMNALPIKKRDTGAPMITSEIGGMCFTRSLLDTRASINILPKVVFDRHHVAELQPFLLELCLADGSVRKPHELVEDVIVTIEDYYFRVDFYINKLMKYLSQASEDLGAIDFADDQDIDACVEEVMMIDEEVRYEEVPMDEPTLELKTLPSTL